MRKPLLIALLAFLGTSTCYQACTTKDIPQECYTCKYTNPLPQDCMDSYTIDMCVLGPHEQSAQSVLSIDVYCNGALLSTSETITFPEDFFAEQANAGGMCEPK